jgi:hypothetical protein
MTPEAKIWIILNKINDAIAIAPSGEPVFIDIKDLKKKIPREEQEQIFTKLAKDNQLFKIQKKPDYKSNFRYQLQITDADLFRAALNNAHIKHFGSIEMLTDDNFFSVVDVSADIMNQLQMTMTNRATIPLLPSVVRFPSLMPADGINLRDNYCDYRCKAVRYLKDNKHIEDFVLNRDSHRWDQTITITIDRTKFTKFYGRLMDVYKKRVRFPNKETENKTAATIPQSPLKAGGQNPYQSFIDVIDVLLNKIEITPKNRLTENQIQIHMSETSLPQNALGVKELAQILNTIKQSGSFTRAEQADKVVASDITLPTGNVDQQDALFTITEPNKDLLLKEREKWVAAGGGEGQSSIHKIEIVHGKIEIDGLQEELNKIAAAKKDDDRPKFPHRLPAGTKWEDMTIKFVDDENVYVQIKQFKEHVSYKDMGFVGRGKNPDPSEAWVFLRILAQVGGELTIKDAQARDKYKKQKELLVKTLQNYFSLDYDPFYPYRSSTEKSGNSYKIKITLIPSDKQGQANANKNNNDDLGIEEEYKRQAPQVYSEYQ